MPKTFPREAGRSDLAGYVLAFVVTSIAVAIRWLLHPWLGEHLALVTLFAAVATTVWFGGYRPAIFAAVLGYLACDYLFIGPFGRIGFNDVPNLIGILAYVVSCAFIIGFAEALRRSRRAAAEGEARLRRSEQELADFFEHASVGLHWVGPDGLIQRVNRTELDMLGYTRDEYIGHHIAEFHADRPVIDDMLARLADGETLREFPARLVRKDGTIRDVLISSNALIEGGRFIHTRCFTVDVSDRKRAERVQALLAAIVTASDDAIVSKTLEGVILSWNLGAERLFGYTAAEAVGRSINLIIPPELQGEERSILARLRQGERIEHYETIRVAKDGRRIDISLTVSPVRDDSGRIIGASKVARDVSALKRAEMELREANRHKDEFLATLAHELRNPLAPIRNSLGIIRHADGDAAALRQARDTIERQLGHLVRLVDDLLDVSRITRDRMELRRSRVEVGLMIRQIVESCRPLADHEQQRIELTLPAEPIFLDADPVRLTQVFGNLLNNACKYTPGGGTIRVSAERRDREVIVSVRDSGIGIPADQLESIFEMFSQVDQTLERSRGGLGIGLTLVKRLVELHGGHVQAHSEGPGRGSEFVVRLPLPVEQPAVAQPPPAAPAPAAAARRVLVVDDNADSAESMAMLLELSGHEAQVAYDGVAAVESAGRFRPDLILLDIGLPKLNGFDACRRIRQQAWGKRMVLVALTGWGQEEDRRKALDAGFDRHLVKPVDQDVVLALVASLPAPQQTG